MRNIVGKAERKKAKIGKMSRKKGKQGKEEE
jgi:hypothetical protein